MTDVCVVQLTSPQRDRRDRHRMYNPVELQDLLKQIPWIDWTTVLQRSVGKSVSLVGNERIIVAEVDYLKNLGDLLQGSPNE